jgi:hypothetical protein
MHKEYKEYMEEIMKSGNKESIETLEYVFDKSMEYLCESDHDMYEKLEMKLYVAVYGKQLNKEMAEKIIMNMQPYHMKWSLEETESVRKDYGLSDIRDIDFWITMNKMYNDEKETVEHFLPGDMDKQLEMYVYLTKNFINDPDAKPGKVFTYFTVIPE